MGSNLDGGRQVFVFLAGGLCQLTKKAPLGLSYTIRGEASADQSDP